MPGIAPLAAGWARWRTGFVPAPFDPASPLAGETPGSRKIELYIGGAWLDVTRLDSATAGVYYRDDITITRGKADEAATLDRGTARFTLNNRDGRFSPRNPMSPYYGKFGRNTPVRISVVQPNGERRYRFHGEVSSWPQRWDITGTDVYVPVEASGILRRLGSGTSTLNSPLYRSVTQYASRLVAYWPCEDAADATSIGSAVDGAQAMVISGTPTLASNTDFAASSAIPVMGSASFTGYVPTYSTTLGQHQVRFIMSVPAAGATNGQVICQVLTTGTAARWELYYGTGGTLGLRGFDASDASIADSGAVAFGVNGTPLLAAIELSISGSTVTYQMDTWGIGSASGGTWSGTVGGYTLGRIRTVVMASGKALTTTALGHVTVQNVITSLFELSGGLSGNNGEHAGVRLARLCAEEGIPFLRWQPQANTAAMGVQPIDTLTAVINECVDIDMGRLSEPRDTVGLAYRDRESLYDQTARLALDYAQHELADSLDPVDDDQYLHNDVTIKRKDASSSRATKDTGVLSIADVGRYTTTATLNAYTDTQLPDLAGWRLHLGTTDAARYPTIDLNLQHSTFTADETMLTAALVLDVGDLVTIDNPPPWLPPDQIGLLVEGYTERIGGAGQHTLSLNCSPADTQRIAIYDNSAWRYESDGSSLTSDIGTGDTSISVTIPSGPVWSVTDGSFDIAIGGERMTVTAISGSSSPQTFTVTRSVNGIVKTHSANDAVALFRPAVYAI
jgi:hypothetical protein